MYYNMMLIIIEQVEQRTVVTTTTSTSTRKYAKLPHKEVFFFFSLINMNQAIPVVVIEDMAVDTGGDKKRPREVTDAGNDNGNE